MVGVGIEDVAKEGVLLADCHLRVILIFREVGLLWGLLFGKEDFLFLDQSGVKTRCSKLAIFVLDE